MRFALTAAVWISSLGSLTVAGLIAAAFGFMATSLDPTDLLAVGTEPWTNAIAAALAFSGLVVVTALSLTLWHTARFKAVALILTILQVGGVAWACVDVYQDYF